VAVSLVPFSSLAAVPRKSAGASRAQVAMVIGDTSGEDSRLARPSVKASTTTEAMVPSFSRSGAAVFLISGSAGELAAPRCSGQYAR
jgi:hypothetical protein